MKQAEPVDEIEQDQRTVAVRYSFLGWVGAFRHPGRFKIDPWAKVVVATDRGIEIGTVVPLSCPGECDLQAACRRVEQYVENSGQEYLRPEAGEVLRIATPEDLVEQRKINEHAKDKLEFCRQLAAKSGLKMRLVACEHLFGGERIIFYFTADGRIDFRQLVRDLARQYHTRIEMRQIGARDEARIVADYEICGRECCCRNFLKVLRPVNMKMAKLQKATLDPTKVSGRCGRLRCCLRFEQQTYEQLEARLPKIGQTVRVQQGTGVVCDRQIITQLIVLNMGDGKKLAVPVEEVLEVQGADGRRQPPPAPEPEPQQDSDLPLAVRGADFDDEESTLLTNWGAEPEREASNQDKEAAPGGPKSDAGNGGNGSARKPRRRSRRSGRRNRRQRPR